MTTKGTAGAATAEIGPLSPDFAGWNLPQRPEPQVGGASNPMGGWDAYSGFQMLGYGRDCSDSAASASGEHITRMAAALRLWLEYDACDDMTARGLIYTAAFNAARSALASAGQ